MAQETGGANDSGNKAGSERLAAFSDPEDEELYGGVQQVWDEVVRRGEERTAEGAERVASQMLADGQIAAQDMKILLDLAIDEPREDPPWGEWLERARQRVADERQPEAG